MLLLLLVLGYFSEVGYLLFFLIGSLFFYVMLVMVVLLGLGCLILVGGVVVVCVGVFSMDFLVGLGVSSVYVVSLVVLVWF